MKKFLKLIIPPILLSLINNIKPSRYGWKGKYKTWVEASKYCTGYSDEIIIKQVRKSMMSVKMGLAVYERDSVLFKEAKIAIEIAPYIAVLLAKELGKDKLWEQQQIKEFNIITHEFYI